MKKLVTFFAALALILGQSPAYSQDITNQGGDLSNSIPGPNGVQAPAPNIDSAEERDQQARGFIPFHHKMTPAEGLGPRFINNSCGGCHINNGKGLSRIVRNPRKNNSMVIQASLVGLNSDGSPRGIPELGVGVIPDRFIDARGKRRTKFKIRLRKKMIRQRKVKRYPDGTRKPRLKRFKLTFRVPGYKRHEIVSTLRMTPAVVGVGLLESIPEEDIIALSDPNDSDGDGISGVPNYVPDVRNGGTALGRFGFRAGQPTVEQQSAAAAFNEMGLNNTLFNNLGEAIELSEDQLEIMTIYQQLAGVPMARIQGDPVVTQGKQLFVQVGCDDCHTMTHTTKSTVFNELDGQVIHPFTDLLLHDMGPGLADKRPEFSASGSEWRTTPLWGLGFVGTLSSKVKPHYMHDGRARTLEEAILWHGGESEASRLRFENLTKVQRKALIAFLKSL